MPIIFDSADEPGKVWFDDHYISPDEARETANDLLQSAAAAEKRAREIRQDGLVISKESPLTYQVESFSWRDEEYGQADSFRAVVLSDGSLSDDENWLPLGGFYRSEYVFVPEVIA